MNWFKRTPPERHEFLVCDVRDGTYPVFAETWREGPDGLAFFCDDVVALWVAKGDVRRISLRGTTT